MASILFTALALIAAGQAGSVPSAPGDGLARPCSVGKACAPATKGGLAPIRGTQRRRG